MRCSVEKRFTQLGMHLARRRLFLGQFEVWRPMRRRPSPGDAAAAILHVPPNVVRSSITIQVPIL